MFRAEFGLVCAYFAGSLVAMLALAAVLLLQPWLVYGVLILIGIVNAIIGIGVYFELHRKEQVRGKGVGEIR